MADQNEVRSDSFRGNGGDIAVKRFVKAPVREAFGSTQSRVDDAAPAETQVTVGYQPNEVRDNAERGNGTAKYIPANTHGICLGDVPKNGDDEAYLRMGVPDNLRIDQGRNTTADGQNLYDNSGDGIAHNSDHPGFAAEQERISSKEGIPMKNAGAILASAARKASPSAKKANPSLNKVK